jgi:hypothetical protein
VKRATRTIEERDVASRYWRRVARWRAGEAAAIKRRVRRRERHLAKTDLHQARPEPEN